MDPVVEDKKWQGYPRQCRDSSSIREDIRPRNNDGTFRDMSRFKPLAEEKMNPELKKLLAKTKKPNKYNARPTYAYGFRFASEAEAERYKHLRLLKEAGEVKWIGRQIPFDLPGGIKYRVDFFVIWKDGTWTAEDVKGVRTQVYTLKKKLMKEFWGIEIKEMKV